ncbi:MAG: transketolase family protein [Chloroflexi bacterium]|nr:transketolase family protein [Chloroflexota bacterium]MCL5110906.1 transketolase family protein [Chloroflexota bacterium]
MAATQTPTSQPTKSTRDGFGEALLEIGRANPNVVALTADTFTLSRIDMFAKEHPERTFDVGIAEQNLLGIAAGLASTGLEPYVTSYAPFLTARSLEQLRNDICYTGFNVKVCAVCGGIAISVGGSTHHAIDDLAFLRAIPNITVLVPADAVESYKLTKAMAQHPGPTYLRMGGRAPEPLLGIGDYPVEIGKASQLREGKDLTIIACGSLVLPSLRAAEALAGEGIEARVLSMHTIKPLDRDAIVKAAKETKRIVTAEEHNVHGGLGGAVAEVLAETVPVPMRMLGIKDVFATIGGLQELYDLYHLNTQGVLETVKAVLEA